jgi:hypothetical protein
VRVWVGGKSGWGTQKTASAPLDGSREAAERVAPGSFPRLLDWGELWASQSKREAMFNSHKNRTKKSVKGMERRGNLNHPPWLS